MTKKKPLMTKKLQLPSGRSAVVKSNKKMTKGDLEDISNLFDQEMYQTGARSEVVEARMNDELSYFVRIYKNDSKYELVVII